MKRISLSIAIALFVIACSSTEIKEAPKPKLAFDFKAYVPTTIDEVVKLAKNIHETEGDGGVAIINTRYKIKYKLPKLPTKVDEYGYIVLGSLTDFLQTPVKLEDIFTYQLAIPKGKFKVVLYFQDVLVRYTLSNAKSEVYLYVLYASYNDFDKTAILLVNAVNNETDEAIVQKDLQ